LISLNDAKSSHLSIVLQKEMFNTLRVNDTEDCISFKLAVKPLCLTLKHLKGIDSLNITILTKGIEHLFNMNLTLTNSIKRKHRFHFTDVPSYNVLFDDTEASYVKASPKIFLRILEHIPSSPEIYIHADANNFKVQSRNTIGLETKNISTELCIKTEEFDEYVYKSDNESECIIFTVKEMKALLGICEAKGIEEFYLFFSYAGSPIKLSCNSDLFSINLIQMTLKEKEKTKINENQYHDSSGINLIKGKSNSNTRESTQSTQVKGKVNIRKRRIMEDDDDNDENTENKLNNEYNEYEYNDNDNDN